MTAPSIARLKVTLDDVKPAVRRRVEVPPAIRLDRPQTSSQTRSPIPRTGATPK